MSYKSILQNKGYLLASGSMKKLFHPWKLSIVQKILYNGKRFFRFFLMVIPWHHCKKHLLEALFLRVLNPKVLNYQYTST